MVTAVGCAQQLNSPATTRLGAAHHRTWLKAKRGRPTWPWAIKAQPCSMLRPPVGARRLLLQAWLASIEACQLRRPPKSCWLLLLLLSLATPEAWHKGLCIQPSLKESSKFVCTDVQPVSLARQQSMCMR